MRRDVDWNAIRNAYRTGVPRLGLVAEIHNVPKTTIISRAKRWGWRRDLVEKVRVETQRLLALSPEEYERELARSRPSR